MAQCGRVIWPHRPSNMAICTKEVMHQPPDRIISLIACVYIQHMLPVLKHFTGACINVLDRIQSLSRLENIILRYKNDICRRQLIDVCLQTASTSAKRPPQLSLYMTIAQIPSPRRPRNSGKRMFSEIRDGHFITVKGTVPLTHLLNRVHSDRHLY